MLMKHLTALTLASAAGLFFSLEAEANSRFTIENQMDQKATIYIYTGGDGVCKAEQKIKTASAGETDSYGCTGNGKNQCKIRIYIDEVTGGRRICKGAMNTCGKKARKVDNGSKVTLSEANDGSFVCTFE